MYRLSNNSFDSTLVASKLLVTPTQPPGANRQPTHSMLVSAEQSPPDAVNTPPIYLTWVLLSLIGR